MITREPLVINPNVTSKLTPLSTWLPIRWNLTFGMHPLRAVCIYFAYVFLGGVLIAPWLYQFMQWAATIFPGIESTGQSPFYRFVNRSFIILGLIGLWPFFRSIGIPSREQVGLGNIRNSWKPFAQGFLLGFVSLAAIAAILLLSGAHVFEDNISISRLATRIVSATLTAIAVSFIEELFFRGALMGALQRSIHWIYAVLISSALYALLHFFERPENPQSMTWITGITCFRGMLQGFTDFEMLIPGFFNLMLVGIILGIGFKQTGTLYFPIGLHAGWVFWQKLYRYISAQPQNQDLWFWGTGKLINGWLAFLVLLGVLGFQWRKYSRSLSPTSTQDPVAEHHARN